MTDDPVLKKVVNVFKKKGGAEGMSVGADKQIIQQFISNPDNPFLVSFPRTGSHWLRMLMELYFEQPSLTRVFFFPDKTDYLTYHTHDIDLDVVCRNVLYLYRDPVETIFSQLKYYKQDITNDTDIQHWADLYGRHVDKWLHRETESSKKTVIRYDRLRNRMEEEFTKICDHFGRPFDMAKLADAADAVDKSRVKKKTLHDPQVVNLSNEYDNLREQFVETKGAFVWQTFLANQREHLRDDFSPSTDNT